MRENALAYQLHDTQKQGAATPPWSLDLLPLILGAQDWSVIERGVLQRMRLLNAVLRDVYGPQEVLRRGLLPPALVTGHPGYLRPMCGARVAGDTAARGGLRPARGPDGQWCLLAQHTQGPSGLGYLLENRVIVSRLFPRAFRGLRVQRLPPATARCWKACRRCPGGAQRAHRAAHARPLRRHLFRACLRRATRA